MAQTHSETMMASTMNTGEPGSCDNRSRLNLLGNVPNPRAAAIMTLFVATMVMNAFPPSPDHVITGLVRDELGHPVVVDDAEVILTTGAGAALRTFIKPNLKPGHNYLLRVPLDSGLTADPYKPTALKPTVPFRLSVRMGGVTYLPIQMQGDFMHLGQPAGETHLDLTLGEDLDGDGLPDAWERMLLKEGQTLADIRPDQDTDNDNMNNLDEYLAGTYAFDARDGFKLEILGMNEGRTVLEFTAIRGRNYTIFQSSDMVHWDPATFRLVGEFESDSPLDVYQATEVRLLRVEVNPSDESLGESKKFFKLMLN
jgi:hypothetical protein